MLRLWKSYFFNAKPTATEKCAVLRIEVHCNKMSNVHKGPIRRVIRLVIK